jgi:hypothetical protein
LILIEKKGKILRGPLRPILKDKLVDAGAKLPLRFSKKKISDFEKINLFFLLFLCVKPKNTEGPPLPFFFNY